MKRLNFFTLTLFISLFFSCLTKEETSEVTTETEETSEATSSTDSDGWTLLFDGKSLDGWHNYLSDSVSGWYVENGILITDGGNNDIVSDQEYENFELDFEWSISEKGNSGVFFYVVEDEKYPVTYATAPEYQLIDDENYPIELKPVQHTAANYDLIVADEATINPPGSFNQSKIIVDHGKVEHWLNGTKVVSYELGSEDWKELVKNSKFATMDSYAAVHKGRIGLQDHGDKVMFKSIKIKTL